MQQCFLKLKFSRMNQPEGNILQFSIMIPTLYHLQAKNFPCFPLNHRPSKSLPQVFLAQVCIFDTAAGFEALRKIQFSTLKTGSHLQKTLCL